jgi:hypothetical protein
MRSTSGIEWLTSSTVRDSSRSEVSTAVVIACRTATSRPEKGSSSRSSSGPCASAATSASFVRAPLDMSATFVRASSSSSMEPTVFLAALHVA